MECCLVCVLLAIETRALQALGKHFLDWFLLANFLGIFKEPGFFEPLFLCWFVCFYLYFLTFACFGISFFKFILLSYILSWLKFPFPPVISPPFPRSPSPRSTFPPSSLQNRAGVPGLSPKHGISSSRKTRHLPHVKSRWGNSAGGKYNFKFFKPYFLMIVLKHFNLPCSPPTTRGSGKERAQGWGEEVDQFRKVLWSNSCLCSLEIGSSVYRLAGSNSLIHS